MKLTYNKHIWGVLFLISLSAPMFLWNERAILIAPLFILFLFSRKSIVPLNKTKFSLFSFIFIFLLYLVIFFPFRVASDLSLYSVIVGLGCVFAFFIHKNEKKYIIDGYITFMSLAALLSVISFFLFALNAPFPKIQFINGVRTDHTFLYFFSLYMDTQVNSFSGFSFARFNGFFKEPGHFGVFLGLAFSLIDKPLLSKRGKLILLGVASTLSAAAILTILVSIFIKYFKPKYTVFILMIAALILVLSFVPFISELVNYYFISKFTAEGGVLGSRTKVATESLSFFPGFFSHFLGTSSMYILELAKTTSDFRRLFFESGYVAFFGLLILFIIQLVASKQVKSLLLVNVSLILLIIVAHRSWFFYQGFFWFFIAILLSYSADVAKSPNSEEDFQFN